MMSVMGNQPVLWVNAKALVATGPCSESDLQNWNAALLAACASHPIMRIYNWAAVLKDKWFIPDGIHYYSAGYAARAHLIPNALAKAFPFGRQSPSSCVVDTGSISVPVLGISRRPFDAGRMRITVLRRSESSLILVSLRSERGTPLLMRILMDV